MQKFKAALHCHSIYSALDGMEKLEEIVKKAEEYNLTGVAITDHGNISAAYKWHKITKNSKIKGIIGYEAYFVLDSTKKEKNEDRYHLTLLANGRRGLLDLIKLSSFASTKGFFYKPRIDFEAIKKWNKSKNIICLSGCMAGLIPQMILNNENEEKIIETIKIFQASFGEDNFYLEIMPPQKDNQNIKIYTDKLIDISRKYGIKIVATHDSHYINSEDAEAHDLLLAINTKQKLSNNNRFKINGTYHFRTPQEMEESFKHCIEALETTDEITNKIDTNYFPKTKPHMPTIDSEIKAEERVSKFCERKLENYFKKINANEETKNKYLERYKSEFEILKQYNIFDYFAVLKVIIDYAKDNDIFVGPGRGSAAGSLIAFLLGITGADPIKYGLLFGRFLNEGRLATGSLPDIDVDFEASRRQEVYEFIRKYFGETRTCNIITFNYLKPKSAIKDTGRVLEIEYSVMNELTKAMPDDFDFDNVHEYPVIQEAAIKYPKLFSLAKTITGSIRHVGMHAAGLIICPNILTNIIPVTSILNRTVKERMLTSQFDMKDIENLGLIKIDVLGSSTQTQIHNTINLIKQNHGIDININNIDLQDENVYDKIFCQLNTESVFQMASDIMKSAILHIMPRNIFDLTVLNAIVRPGAKEFIPVYAENKANKENINYIDDGLINILKETSGILIYQEQVMEICKSYAGFTEAQSDDIRRAIGKKIPEVINSYREKFIHGAIANGHKQEIAEEIYSLFVAFGEYGFNKSHSLCYSLIAYQTAWLKYYYPAEFFAATLTIELIDDTKNEDISYGYIRSVKNELEVFNVSLLPPDINKSLPIFSVENNNIRFGLTALKGIGINTAISICETRNSTPYKDFVDFIIRNGDKQISKPVLVSLIMSGAFDSLNKNRFALMQNFEKIKLSVNKKQDENMVFSFMEELNSDIGYGLNSSVVEFPKTEILKKQREIAGTYFDGHPLDEYRKQFDKMSFNSKKLLYTPKDERIQFICKITNVFRTKTKKKNEEMCFITGEDFYNEMSITVFPKVYRETMDLLYLNNVVVITGKINIYNEKAGIIADEISILLK